MSEILKVKERYSSYLMKITGVVGIGASNTNIIIYVESLTPELAAFLPKELDGVPVQIIKTGKFIITSLLERIAVAQAIYADRTTKMRPAPGGISVGHPNVTAGTLSCRARDKSTGQILGLSNNHVIGLQWGTETVGAKGDPILQPGPADGGTLNDKIGELDRWVPVKLEPETNIVDAAAFSSNMLAEEILEIGRPDTIIDPQPGTKILKSGRTSGITYGTILDVNATLSVEGWGACVFTNVITVTPAILSPGDSGSWCGQIDTFRTVGLGFAGSTEISAVCRGSKVEELLNLEIIPPLPYLSKRLLGFGLLSGGILATGMIVSRSPKEKT